MKALIFVCLLFVGCYHEKETEGSTDNHSGTAASQYQFYTAIFTANDSSIVFENLGEKMYMRILDSNDAIRYDNVNGKLRVTIEFEVFRIE